MIKYRIDIINDQLPVLLTKSILYKLICHINKSCSFLVKIEMESLLEVQYIKYLIRVFKSNDEYLTAFHILGNRSLNKKTICNIFAKQFEMLTINGYKCFDKVKVESLNKGYLRFDFNCSQLFYYACHNVIKTFDMSNFV